MDNKDNSKRNIDILDMFEIKMIKDTDGSLVPGNYFNKVGCNGFYLKAKKGSLLERVMNMSMAKFKLENDPENYASEAMLELWLSIDKYYNKLGYNDSVKGDGFIFTDVKYKMMDKAKLAKGNVSVCDRTTGKYYINKIESYEQKFIEEADKLRNQKDERYLCDIYNTIFTEEYETTSEFKKWLEKNKTYALTKKQIDYLNGDVIINDASGIWRIHKNIIKRIENCYANDKLRKEKVNKLTKKLKNINYLLDFKDEDDLLDRLEKVSHRKDDNILMKLFENMNKEECILLTQVISNGKRDIYDKKFFYNIIKILVKEENYINDLIENVKKESEIPWD